MIEQTEPHAYRWRLTTVERWRVLTWLWLGIAVLTVVLGGGLAFLGCIAVSTVFNVGSVILERIDPSA